MQESVSMNARKCVHAQKPYTSKAVAQGGTPAWHSRMNQAREEEEREARRIMERKAAQQNKNNLFN